MQDDYRLDYGIASQCEADVDQWCSLEKVMVLRPCASSVVKVLGLQQWCEHQTLTAFYKQQQHLI